MLFYREGIIKRVLYIHAKKKEERRKFFSRIDKEIMVVVR
jgi:hypothetical protein